MSDHRERDHRDTGPDDRRQPGGAGELLPAVTTEAEHDAYRAALADLLACNKRYGPNSTYMTEAWSRARDLLKDRPR